MEAGSAPAPKRPASRRLAGLFHGRPRLQVGALLAGPVGWLVVGYLGSLAVLFITSFWTLGELSGEIERTLTLDNFKDVVSEPVYRSVAAPHDRDRAARHGHVRAAGLPARVLHGEGREAAGARPAGGRGADAAVVLLPGEGLRLARDPQRGGRPQLVPRSVRDLGPGLRDGRRLAGDDLHLAAVHDHPDLRGPRTDPGHAAERLRGPGREALHHLPPGDPAAGASRP